MERTVGVNGQRRRAAPDGRSGRPAQPYRRVLGWFFVLEGVGIAAIWMLSLPQAFSDGLFAYAGTRTSGNIPIFHVVAEGTMAVTSLVAGIGLLRTRPWARTVALVGAGMLIYSAVNSSGWLLENQPPVLLVTVASLIGAVVAVLVLWRWRRAEGSTPSAAVERGVPVGGEDTVHPWSMN